MTDRVDVRRGSGNAAVAAHAAGQLVGDGRRPERKGNTTKSSPSPSPRSSRAGAPRRGAARRGRAERRLDPCAASADELDRQASSTGFETRSTTARVCDLARRDEGRGRAARRVRDRRVARRKPCSRVEQAAVAVVHDLAEAERARRVEELDSELLVEDARRTAARHVDLHPVVLVLGDLRPPRARRRPPPDRTGGSRAAERSSRRTRADGRAEPVAARVQPVPPHAALAPRLGIDDGDLTRLGREDRHDVRPRKPLGFSTSTARLSSRRGTTPPRHRRAPPLTRARRYERGLRLPLPAPDSRPDSASPRGSAAPQVCSSKRAIRSYTACASTVEPEERRGSGRFARRPARGD